MTRRGRRGRPAGAVVLRSSCSRPAGEPVAAGERGEIVVRTSLPGAITRGYLSNPEATARALRGEAFHTGDLGSFDADGNMYFHGRMTDNVRVRGENVSALEVEQVVAKHPAVEDCAMIGVAAEIGEQEIKLFVKRRPGAVLDAARAVGLARRTARALSEPALHRDGRRVRAHREPAHHEARAARSPRPHGTGSVLRDFIQEIQQQPADTRRLLLLHPVPGAVDAGGSRASACRRSPAFARTRRASGRRPSRSCRR